MVLVLREGRIRAEHRDSQDRGDVSWCTQQDEPGFYHDRIITAVITGFNLRCQPSFPARRCIGQRTTRARAASPHSAARPGTRASTGSIPCFSTYLAVEDHVRRYP